MKRPGPIGGRFFSHLEQTMSRFRRKVLVACAAAVFGLSSTASEASGSAVGYRIPQQAHMAVWCHDIEAAREQLEANPFFQLLVKEHSGEELEQRTVGHVMRRLPISGADPLFSFWATVLPMVDQGLRQSADSATSVFQFTAMDLQETFSGSLAIYSTMYDLYVQNNIEIVEWDVILAADFKASEKERVERFLENTLARIPDEARKKKVSYYGEDVYHLTYYLDEEAPLPGDNRDNLDLGLVQEIPVIVEYGFVDGVFLLAEGRGEPLKRAIRALKDEGKPLRLSEQERMRAPLREIGDSNEAIYLYYDLSHHVRELGDFPSQKQNTELLKSLDLHQGGPVLARLDLNEEHARLLASVGMPSSPGGIFSLLTEFPENPLKRLNLVPSDADLAASVSVDMQKLYVQYRRVMSVLYPGSQQFIETAFRQIEKTAGMDIEQDLLARSTGELIAYARPGEGNPEHELNKVSAFCFPLTGGKEAPEALNRLLRQITENDLKLVDLEKSDYQGHTVWETPAPAVTKRRPPGLHLAATPNGVALASTGAELRALLRRLAGSENGSILENESYRKRLQDVETDGLRGFVYMPPKAVVENYMAKTRLGRQLKEMRGEQPDAPDVDSLLGPSWWTLHVSEGTALFTYMIEGAGKAHE